MSRPAGLYLGVDVGTASARAGLFDRTGRMAGSASHPIRTFRPEEGHVEQSSDDIWSACCRAVRLALVEAGAGPETVRGLGFDATCSLVVLDAADRPVTVSTTGRDEQNVVVWMDHRATEQAARLNRTGHRVLDFVGGAISPEMETPKLLWLKERLPGSFSRAARFLDLADFLSYRATGDETRSLCTTVCKWTYLGHEPGGEADGVGRWDEGFLAEAGLGELAGEGRARIGRRVRPMGEPLGGGLTERSAAELGLAPGTPVAVSIIDAHAGGLGLLAAGLDSPEPSALGSRLALVGGTSSCHMAVSPEPRHVPGIWGPYYSAMVPGLWLSEGGQSATGALVDHVVLGHPRSGELAEEARREGTSVYELLNRRLDALAARSPAPERLTEGLHVLPYFHGNRSPRADPTLAGMVSGLRLGDSVDGLALLYLATVQAIAHGTRHIVDRLNGHGFAIETIPMCGGGAKNRVFVREHADATGCEVLLPREPEAVLLGAAMLGATASGEVPTLVEAMASMSAAPERIAPAGGEAARFHERKHAVFQRMYDDQMAYRALMR